MDEGLKQQAREWFERGDHDIETAQLLCDQRGYTDAIAHHIQQAIEKYLKGYLVLRGQKPPWVHELDTLLNLVAKFEGDLYPPSNCARKRRGTTARIAIPRATCRIRARRDQGGLGFGMATGEANSP